MSKRFTFSLTVSKRALQVGPRISDVRAAKARINGYRRYCLYKDVGLYRGWWKNDKRHGIGTQINKETREIYEGFFKDDLSCGYGVSSKMNTNGLRQMLHEGSYANGVPNGRGVLHTDTFQYKGNIFNGKASGFGIAWYYDGNIYIGTWFNGKRMGLGMLIDQNENRYDGSWYDDKKHGYGQFCFFDRGQALEGIWVADVCKTGSVRNIKYRQGGKNPVKLPIPELELKNWPSTYYRWEQKALAQVGKYIREDLGIPDLVPEQEETNPVKGQEDDEELSFCYSDDYDNNPYLRYSASIAKVQPCVRFDY